MARRNTIAVALLGAAVLLIPSLGLGSTPVGTQAGNTTEGIIPSEVTQTIKLTVRELQSAPNRIHVYDPATESTHVIVLSEKMRLTARRKKDFGGRRKLEFSDLEKGQTVKVTYRTDDGRITGIQILEKAS